MPAPATISSIPLSKSPPLGRHHAGDPSCPPSNAMRSTMQYLLLIYSDEAAMASITEAQGGQMMAAYNAYAEAMGKAGVLEGGNRLRPTSATTTVRIANGKTTVLDGPYRSEERRVGEE